MPRGRVRSHRQAYVYPDDFGPALTLIKEASGLSWAELARQFGTDKVNVWRWRNGVRPSTRYVLALQELARRLDFEHLLPKASARRDPGPLR